MTNEQFTQKLDEMIDEFDAIYESLEAKSQKSTFLQADLKDVMAEVKGQAAQAVRDLSVRHMQEKVADFLETGNDNNA